MFNHNYDIALRVVKSFMVESGTYNPMFTRPYTSVLDNRALNNFIEATQGGTNINRYNVAPIASSIVAPSAQPDAQVAISNGWNEKRIIFMMEIEQVGTGMSTVISGYADKIDLSHSGILDPMLQLTINSAMCLSTVQKVGPHGVIETKRVIDNAHLLGTHTIHAVQPLVSQVQDPNLFNSTGNRLYMQRPSDVANNLSLGFFGDVVSVDGRTELVGNRLNKSSRSNNVASTYLSDTINAIALHKMAPDVGVGNYTHNDVYADAANKMAEADISADPIMRYINANSNIRTFGTVTWQQMCAMFPELDNATEYFKTSAMPVELTNGSHFSSSHGNFEYWQNTSFEAMYASNLMQTIPSIMSQNLLTGYAGMFTNNTIDGSYQVVTTDARSFIDGFDRTSAIRLLEDRILHEVLPNITNGNQRVVDITVNLSLIRDGYISISLDCGYAIEFSAPCWGDALYLPTVTSNRDSLSLISSTVSQLVSLNQEDS